MPINIEERYKLIFQEHHYASDYRLRLLRGWCVMIAALAAAFVWIQQAATRLSWLVSALALVATVLVWLGDRRNRTALQGAKKAGKAIEESADAGIPEPERFFPRIQASALARYPTHSSLLDVFFTLLSGLLILATIYLFVKSGALSAPTSSPEPAAGQKGSLVTETLKDWTEIAHGGLTCLAIVVGGVWAFFRFVWTREFRPRAEIEHSVLLRKLGQTLTLIRVSVTVRNTGLVLLQWKEGFVWLQQVLPCANVDWLTKQLDADSRCKSEADWPFVKKKVSLMGCIQEIEPGEFDTAHADFILSEELNAVLVYSHVSNAGKKSVGWNHTTFHDVTCPKEKDDAEA